MYEIIWPRELTIVPAPALICVGPRHAGTRFRTRLDGLWGSFFLSEREYEVERLQVADSRLQIPGCRFQVPGSGLQRISERRQCFFFKWVKKRRKCATANPLFRSNVFSYLMFWIHNSYTVQLNWYLKLRYLSHLQIQSLTLAYFRRKC